MTELQETEFLSDTEVDTLVQQTLATSTRKDISSLTRVPQTREISEHEALEYQAHVGDKTIHFFAKIFRPTMFGEDMRETVQKEVDCIQKINERIPGATANLLGYSTESPPVLITQAIEGFNPLNVFLKTADDTTQTRVITEALSLLHTVHTIDIVHGDPRLRNLGIVEDTAAHSHSLKLIDFESAEIFKGEDPTKAILQENDILTFIRSISKVIPGYYETHQESVHQLLAKEYSPTFSQRIRSRLADPRVL